jgi:transcriptional regulator with XRE-family HTH domain
MEDIKSIVAKNISELRQSHKMTQLELAEKLNYSDKTISKWERAESSPDISVLIEIANLFGVTLDYLVKAEHEEETAVTDSKPEEEKKYNRKAIAYISESIGWIVAIFAFIITTLILQKMSFQFLYFVYAMPIVLIVKLVFNSVWFNPRHNYYIISLLMWSLLATIQITFLYFKINVALIYLLGVAGQIVIVLWSFIAKPKRNQQ